MKKPLVAMNRHDQDKLLAMFYEEIIEEWRNFFPSCENQKAVNLLLIHFPQKLVAYYKKKGTTVTDSQVHIYISLNIKRNTKMVVDCTTFCWILLHSFFRLSYTEYYPANYSLC